VHQRLRQTRLAEAAELALQLERGQTERNALAAAEERLRLAEELHDVVGHGITVILLQARLGRRALEGDPERAQDPQRASAAIGIIEERGRAVMEEMQRLLGVLHGDDSPTLAPLPGIEQLERLASEVREAGIDVEIGYEGAVRRLPEGIEVSAYRIVQEALTNTVRHAGASRATISLAYERHVLEIEVVDDGSGADGQPNGSGRGRGLLGMRERAKRLGGSLDAGPAPGRGFRVHAVLPLGDASRSPGPVSDEELASAMTGSVGAGRPAPR
jgi:signal transduction histidine kinase